ncbi:MAG TPA: 1,2-phenylacetyl-CoA epoxidase subunit PaaD [Candidimonas sp.]|nr:1,2-phenylacetyl-CoA epoxidase subunit PaaD [Candidimonas sp.]
MNAIAATAAIDDVMQWLALVPDPEIPVLSVVDLGLIRNVAFDGHTCVVTITPTYSGCPAMQEISADIQSTLQAHGVEQVRIETQLSPAWTTDWMTAKGHEALKGFGIAPPGEKAINISGITRGAADVVVPCPLCGSSHTRLISQFGSTSCKALYRCNDCGEPFDYFKAH